MILTFHKTIPAPFVLLVLWNMGLSAAGVQAANPRAQDPPAIGTDFGNDSHPDPGVVYYIPGADMPDDAVLQQLQHIREQGYHHINISSWVWTLPQPGSPLRHRVELILNWCDQNSLGVWLLHNIQYGTPEYGDFEQAIKDPAAYVRPVVVDWIDVLRGHPCVRGVQLGNEVGPAIPRDSSRVPLYVEGFSEWLRQRYQAPAKMNAAWGTNFASFDAVGLPAADTPGRVDLQQFANLQFGRFYGTIFNTLFKPALGAHLGYTSKTGPDPYLYAAYPGATVLGWDDLVANHPLWTMRVLTDCDARPAFNAEMHLYHDNYAYYPSVELTRYRYLMDALGGEWISSSFSWGAWNKPEIAAIQAATPQALGEVARLEPELRRFDKARRSARIGVLVTLPLLELSSRNIAERPVLAPRGSEVKSSTERDAVPLEDAYAALAATGRAWRYVLDNNLSLQGRQLDVLIVPGNRRIPTGTLRQLAALPHRVRVVWAGDWPVETEYGQPLQADLLRELQRRCLRETDLDRVARDYADPHLTKLYREITVVSYSWWSLKKGSFAFGVRYPRVEARRAAVPGHSILVALINNSRETVNIPGAAMLPWYTRSDRIWDLTAQPAQEVNARADAPIELGPFDVHLYRYERVSR